MWLVGVVIRRYIDILIIHVIINFPYSTCIRSFLAEASLLLCSFLNVFSVLFRLFFYNIIIANVTHTIFEIIQKKSRSREYKNYSIISIIKNGERTSTARARLRVSRLPRARYGIRSE